MKHLSKVFASFVAMALAASPVLAESFTVNGVPSDTPAIDVSNTYVAPEDGPIADDEFINFDDMTAPGLFNDQVPLTNEYAAQGVIFQGLGEVLNESGGFGISNFSSPNFLAFNTGVGANPPETMLFNPEISDISILAGHSSSGTITMTAYNAGGGVLGSTTITGTSALQTMSLSGMNGCASVVLDFTGNVACFDDLWFDNGPGDPVTLTLTPVVDTVPMGGGNVVYDASLVSTIPAQIPGLRYQTFATLPNQQVFGPIDNIPFTLFPYMNLQVTGMTVSVPGSAPAGNYMFEAKAGVPNSPPQQVSDSFPFSKQGAGWFEDFNDGMAQGMDFFVGPGSYSIDGGYCKIDVVGNTTDWGSGSYTSSSFGNFSASTTFMYEVTNGYSCGMLFRGDGPQDGDYNGYAVYISNTSYSAWVYTAGAPTNLIGWTTGTAINTGVGAVNTLQIDASGGTVDITINGNYEGSFSDGTYASGYVGIVTAYTNESWFDEVGASNAPAPNSIGPAHLGEIESVYRDHMGIECAPYDRGVAFDRSAEFATDSYEFHPEEWIGSSSFGTASNGGSAVNVPTEFALETAYPNPFNPSTSFAVTLPEASDLTVNVYNVAGQLVASVANGDYTAGRHTMTFDASNLASGLYFIRAMVPGQLNQTQKVMLVR